MTKDFFVSGSSFITKRSANFIQLGTKVLGYLGILKRFYRDKKFEELLNLSQS